MWHRGSLVHVLNSPRRKPAQFHNPCSTIFDRQSTIRGWQSLVQAYCFWSSQAVVSEAGRGKLDWRNPAESLCPPISLLSSSAHTFASSESLWPLVKKDSHPSQLGKLAFIPIFRCIHTCKVSQAPTTGPLSPLVSRKHFQMGVPISKACWSEVYGSS